MNVKGFGLQRVNLIGMKIVCFLVLMIESTTFPFEVLN